MDPIAQFKPTFITKDSIKLYFKNYYKIIQILQYFLKYILSYISINKGIRPHTYKFFVFS